jgi:hypothetical protein
VIPRVRKIFHNFPAGFQDSSIFRRVLIKSLADSAMPEPSLSRFDGSVPALTIGYGSMGSRDIYRSR